jgi:dipeptidyl aminopeptidase/acylaminoacyl peptidase
MRRPLSSLAALLAVVVLSTLVVAPASAAAKKAGLPPILDRVLFFGDPEISGAQLSPDGRFITFIKPLDGTRNIWVKKTEEPFDKARPLTADKKRPIPGYFWSRDSKFVLFVQDNDGDENYNVYAVDPAAEQAAGSRVPPARNLTALEKTRALIYSVPRKMPDVIFVGLNDRDQSWHDLYRVEIRSGERKLMRENKDRIAGWFFDLDGQLRLAERVADDGSTEILRVDDEGFKQVYSCSVLETCNPVRYHKDGRRVYMVTNKGDDVDLVRLVLFDPTTGKEEVVESDPLKRVDFGDAMFSEVTDELIATFYEDERKRVYWRDKEFESDYALMTKKLGDKDVVPASSTADEKVWLVTATSDVEPGQRYLFDRKSKKLTLQYTVFDKLPREHLAPMKAVHYPSSDGLEIPAFLTLPLGVEPKGLPLLVFPHGGPWSRDAWGYDALAQFFANRGYAVLQPNFRGSTGYGKKFLNAGNNEWGQKMQDDLTWGVKHMVANGTADPKRVAIMGGSYGGYATLAGVAFTPDVYAAAVSIVGPSNLITLLDSIPPYWESIRTVFHYRMGDPRTPEGRKQLERQSPLNSAEKIKTPLLVVQGANDPRVKKAESDQIVVALRDRKFPVEYLVAPDEGHGFAHPINNLALFATAEKFLAKHVGGRVQEDVKTEVAEKLKAITVDVATVTLPKKVDLATVGVPKPAQGLVAGTHTYDAKIEVAGQTMNLSIEREIKEENGHWVVVDRVKGPMGDGEDRVTLDKSTLTLIDRVARQGPAQIEVSYGADKASGKMNISGQERPLDISIGGPVFADGAGGADVVAALPLAEGYTATYRNVDLQQQAEKVIRLVVTGIESVTVPAGTFEAWRVELSPATGDPGGSTVWIARDTRAVVKVSAILPQLNGAVMTHELTR